jgi:hypothetical protein
MIPEVLDEGEKLSAGSLPGVGIDQPVANAI